MLTVSRPLRSAMVVAAIVSQVLTWGALGAGADDRPRAERVLTFSADGRGGARVPNPTLVRATGGRGRATGGLRYDVAQFGYQEDEFLVEGVAKAYPPADLPDAPYRTRMIVWTPTDPAHFNGTTVVEWAQVSDFGKFELTIELNYQAPLLEAEGFAFALVSAERRGVCDTDADGCVSSSLQGADPERYGTLEHPGDAYSFDIFSQSLQAIKHPKGIAPLGRLGPTTIIAEGHQRSVDKYSVDHPAVPATAADPFSVYGPLNAYLASGADSDARVADAFLIDAAAPAVEPTYRVPTLHHLDESAVRRRPTPDGPRHVTWEVTGAPHADRWAGDHASIPSPGPLRPRLTREEEEDRRRAIDDVSLEPDAAAMRCIPTGATGDVFPRRYTLNAGLMALRAWVEQGERAPAAPRLARTAALPTDPSKKLRRDHDGNAIGGLRLPIIDVPVAAYNGEFCISAGITTPLSPERLAELYPTHRAYVQRLLAATNRAVAKGYLVCQDAESILRKASTLSVGGTDGFTAAPRCARDRPSPRSTR